MLESYVRASDSQCGGWHHAKCDTLQKLPSSPRESQPLEAAPFPEATLPNTLQTNVRNGVACVMESHSSNEESHERTRVQPSLPTRIWSRPRHVPLGDDARAVTQLTWTRERHVCYCSQGCIESSVASHGRYEELDIKQLEPSSRKTTMMTYIKFIAEVILLHVAMAMLGAASEW
jgi:hypothetical protein